MRLFCLLYPSDQIQQTLSGESEKHPQQAICQPVSGKFLHADVGQMDLYLNYAHIHRMHEDENPPVGLILCLQKDWAVARYALDRLMCRNH
ncbi:MAG: PDDEXK nuclease domain-containing protein [Gemmatimonadota bacterium]|nr:PDDEXK nuclease domain-containing protein [Gemmatimonadota bacterium]